MQSSEIPLAALIDSFSEITDFDKKHRANHFAYDLIEFSLFQKKTPLMLSLDEAKKRDMFWLVSYMIWQESALNSQIDEIKNRLAFANVMKQNFNQGYIGPIANDYFINKKFKLFSGEYGSQSLFYQQGNEICINPSIQFPQIPGANLFLELYSNISAYQSWRVTKLSLALSRCFEQISGLSVALVQYYVNNSGFSSIWQNFLSFADEYYRVPVENTPFNTPGILFFHIAMHYDAPDIFLKWLQLGATVAALDSSSQRRAIQFAIRMDHKELFIKLISNGIIPLPKDLLLAFKSIKEFLDYKPGRNFVSIRKSLRPRAYNREVLNRLIADESNTSDEESSDDELDNFQVVRSANLQNKTLLFRGCHFIKQNFTQATKQDARKHQYHQQTVYCTATRNLAPKLMRNPDNSINFHHADQLVKSYFEMLKMTPDKPELNDNYNKVARKMAHAPAHFESLYIHFIQAYVNSYNALFNNGGMARNFNFFNNDNATLSTSAESKVAFKYAAGSWINHSNVFLGKIRRSTGGLKHRRLGYVQVYLIDQDYLIKHSANIDSLKAMNKIGIPHNFSFGKETVIESSIPAEYIVGYQIFSLPRMDVPWSPTVQITYGLSEKEYYNFRQSLFQGQIDPKVVDSIAEYQAQRLYQQLFTPLINPTQNLVTNMGNLKL